MEYLEKIKEISKVSLKNDKSGHGWDHIKRVLEIAKQIAKDEEVDQEILKASCLLHDISFKDGFIKNHEIPSSKQAQEILEKLGFPKEKIQRVVEVIRNHNRHYGSLTIPIENFSIEGRILCDADRIDGLGSVGIIRMIQFITKNIEVPYFDSRKDELDKSYYGRIKDLINQSEDMLTKKGTEIAKERVEIIKEFIKELEKENLF